ncbi:hypothetical protein [Nocardioides sp. Iso805N]|uniref:hypothetical protein n=1 Tax=Nocardioides sp. Iso805N TaxID=1283287 RepID=UPI0012F72A85|nr:hypothetical protein [Nocardioides sp. Iso805N]
MRRSPLLLVSLAILLTGCGGGTQDIADGPSPAASPTTSMPATPSTSATIATPPAHESAKQFIRRWIQVNTEAQRTGDLTALDSLNEPGCESCKSFARAVTRIYAAGGTIEAADTEILSIARHPDGQYYTRERVPPSRYRESARAKWTKFTGGTDTQIYLVARVGDLWRMAKYSELAGSAE